MGLPNKLVCGHSTGTLDSDSFSSHAQGSEGGAAAGEDPGLHRARQM